MRFPTTLRQNARFFQQNYPTPASPNHDSDVDVLLELQRQPEYDDARSIDELITASDDEHNEGKSEEDEEDDVDTCMLRLHGSPSSAPHTFTARGAAQGQR